MPLYERQMQLVAFVAEKLRDVKLNISNVEDTGGKVVFHLTGLTDDQMDNAVSAATFEVIEREVRYQKEAFALDLDIEIRFVRAEEPKEVTKQN